MANNPRVSRSTSVEDLREKNSQMEAEMSKLAEDVREVMKRQEESSKRQEDSQRKMEESNRAMNDKLNDFGLILERTIRQLTGKDTNFETGENSNANRVQIDDTSRNQGRRVEGNRGEQEFDLNSEEIHWAENNMRRRDNIVRPDDRRSVQLPRMDFPKFDGNDPKMWQTNCEYYFDLYEVPEVYKTRMAVLNFSEDIHEWYRCVTNGNAQLPWDLLVEEVMVRFQNINQKNPVDEFKRLHQLGRVEEFMKKFDRSKSRLLNENPNLNEGFFVSGFISGLKEEIKHQVEVFNSRTLASAYQYALKMEAAQEAQNRKTKEGSKAFKFQKVPSGQTKA